MLCICFGIDTLTSRRHRRASTSTSSALLPGMGSLGRDTSVVLDELGEGLDRALLRLAEVALDHLAVLVDEGDGGEAGGLELGLDEIALLVTAELDHVDLAVHRRRELLHLLLHALAELAPRGVGDDERVLARLLELLRVSLGKLLHLALAVLPEVTVPGLLSSVNVNTTLSLGGTISVGQSNETSLSFTGIVQPRSGITFELEVNKLGGAIFRDRDGILGITDGRVSLGVQRVVRDLVLGNVVEGIFKSPVGDGVALGESTSDGGVLEKVDPSTLESLPPCSSVDHAVGVKSLESALERLDLADAIVFLNVLLPEISAVSLVVGCLVTNGDSFGAENFGLEAIELLNFLQELHCLGEQVEGVDAHDGALAVLEVSQAVQQVGDDDISSDHSIGEDSTLVVLASNFKGKHGLFLQVLQTHFL
mmetsp:Transcript_53260/g.80793  ORF Transcript_53260/g.80793 Transcript_53260/m.80793 type:complete len:422 (-) Transcript_53260:187-1452(-)